MKKSKKRARKTITFRVLLLTFLMVVLASAGIKSYDVYLGTSSNLNIDRSMNINFAQVEEDITSELNNKLNENTVNITVAGDILYHQEQLTAAYDSSNNSYDFSDNFEYVKQYIEEADFSLATCETTFAGEEYEYSGFPCFNTSISALDAMKSTGFDMLSLNTNHILDVSTVGYYNSIDALKSKEFDMLGVKENISDKNYEVKEINGINIGFTSFSFETTQQYGQRAINSIVIPYNLVDLINTFGSETLEQDLQEMQNTVANMKNDGAEFIVFVMHWGDEYSTQYSSQQKYIAEALNSYGVDVIFGSHPHVVQPVEKVKAANSTKETLVFYSLGNFLSNQREDTMGNALSADGAMAQIQLVKNEDGTVVLNNYNYIPTWVHKYTDENSKTKYKILPVKDVLEKTTDFNFKQEVINEIQQSYNSTTSIIGQVQ